MSLLKDSQRRTRDTMTIEPRLFIINFGWRVSQIGRTIGKQGSEHYATALHRVVLYDADAMIIKPRIYN